VREAALAVLLSRFGVPGSAAVGVGLLWETILIAGGLLGGLAYALTRRLDRPAGSVAAGSELGMVREDGR